MYQVIEQTDEEKFEMYNKLPKKQVIEMLMECHRIIERLSTVTTVSNYCTCFSSQCNYINGKLFCADCNKPILTSQ